MFVNTTNDNITFSGLSVSADVDSDWLIYKI